MISATAKTEWHGEVVDRKMESATLQTIYKIAGFIRTTAIRSIRPSKKPSQPGTPPHTQTKRLRKSIVFGVDRRTNIAEIGPNKNIIGEIGEVMEHGKRYRGADYPKRPFMIPAMEKALPRMPQEWMASWGK